MNEPENICLACNLCCDGSMIGFVQIDAEEFPALREILPIEESGEIGFFLQPCTKFCAGCTIYSERPKQCGLFECKLLKDYAQSDIDFKSATDIVRTVIEQKQAIEDKLVNLHIALKSPSFCFQMAELKTWLAHKAKETPLINAHAVLLADIETLNDLVMKHFGVSYF